MPFFNARFSNRVMSFGSTGRPRSAKRVCLGGFSAPLCLWILIMEMYSDALVYLVSRFHFFSWVLYCFSLRDSKVLVQVLHRIRFWDRSFVRCLKVMVLLHLFHDIFQLHTGVEVGDEPPIRFPVFGFCWPEHGGGWSWADCCRTRWDVGWYLPVWELDSMLQRLLLSLLSSCWIMVFSEPGDHMIYRWPGIWSGIWLPKWGRSLRSSSITTWCR